jgi:hypothetical protein
MLTEEESVELLRAVGVRYAGLPTYRDRGQVIRAGRTEPEVEFSTLFVREVGIRFTFQRSGQVRVISQPTADPVALMDAVASATGTSAGSAHTIPALLLPAANEDNWSLLRLASVRSVEPPSSNKSRAHDWEWIAGTGWAGQLCRIAVDSSTLLVRQVDDFGLDVVRASTTEYEPAADLAVTPAELTGPDLISL